MGSVKDIRVIEEPSQEPGLAIMMFSDCYSVFDFGKMPDHIFKKGEVLATTGAYNFEMMEAKGVPTHYLGMVDGGSEKGLSDLVEPSDKMKFEIVEKPKIEFRNGKYDYEIKNEGSYFVPLEVVFRNEIPIGSSIRGRYSPEGLGMGFEKWPDRSVDLEESIVEFSTKMEEKDRYISDDRAQEISGLNDEDFKTLKDRTRRVNSLITQRAEEQGFKHLDGKVEFMYVNGEVKVADVVGTFDENRFSFNGFQVSKEVIRQWYKENDLEWYQAVKEAKHKADEGVRDWKSMVREPRKLDPDFLKSIENLYQAGGNQWTGKDWFEAPDLEEVVNDLRS